MYIYIRRYAWALGTTAFTAATSFVQEASHVVARANEPGFLHVDSRDSCGLPLVASTGPWLAHVHGPDGAAVRVDGVDDLGDGTYSVHFTPRTPGVHSVEAAPLASPSKEVVGVVDVLPDRNAVDDVPPSPPSPPSVPPRSPPPSPPPPCPRQPSPAEPPAPPPHLPGHTAPPSPPPSPPTLPPPSLPPPPSPSPSMPRPSPPPPTWPPPPSPSPPPSAPSPPATSAVTVCAVGSVLLGSHDDVCFFGCLEYPPQQYAKKFICDSDQLNLLLAYLRTYLLTYILTYLGMPRYSSATATS